jgi:glucose-1-phosphate thymidylyltransferase
MKGIILAGGTGSRLYPITKAINKQLLPIYDKPLIYYPLSTLMLAGIKDILIIVRSSDLNSFKILLSDSKKWGVNISFAIQDKPNGIAEAFIIGEEFISNSSCALILGDNIFYGDDLPRILKKYKNNKQGSHIFLYKVSNPKRYGIAYLNKKNKIISVVEKPKKPKSNLAITGLYFYDKNVVSIAKKIKRTTNNEFQITSINKKYLKQNKLNFELFGRGMAWLDTGTYDSLIEASQFIQTIQKRQGFKVCCPEEIAWRQGWINSKQLLEISKKIINKEYSLYLKNLVS